MSALSHPVSEEEAVRQAGLLLVSEHLDRCGYNVLSQDTAVSVRGNRETIDLVAHCAGTSSLVFVTVSTTRGEKAELPEFSLKACRRARLLAAAWLADAPARPDADDIRFDVIAVAIAPASNKLQALDHLQGAL